MMELPERIKQRLYKLVALAERGASGERENAEARLDKLLAKHGIDKSEFLETENVLDYDFSYSSAMEKRLLIQIIASFGFDSYTPYRSVKKLCIECTRAQGAEIGLQFDVYRKALKEEIEMTYDAFIHAQNIFPENDGDDEERPARTKEEVARALKMLRRADGMDKVHVTKGIESK